MEHVRNQREPAVKLLRGQFDRGSNRTCVPNNSFSTRTTGLSPAVTQQCPVTRAQTPKRYEPYIAPHSRTPAVTRANGCGGDSRTYSCMPLHLRDKIADSDKDIMDYSTRQTTRVGRKIHTPAQLFRWSMP